MSNTTPIDWRSAKDALVRWAGGSTGLPVAWGNQSAPQLPYPYVSLLATPAPTDLGVHDEEQWLGDGGLQIVGQREFGLSVQTHVGPPQNVDPDCDAAALIHVALSSLSVPPYRQDLVDAGLALRARGQPQPIDLVVGAEWIGRQLLELRFGIVSVLNPTTMPPLDAVGFFDKIRVSSTITGLANPGGTLKLTDELMDPANP